MGLGGTGARNGPGSRAWVVILAPIVAVAEINPQVGTFSADNPIAPRLAGAVWRYGPELEQGPVHAQPGEAEGPAVGGLSALFFCWFQGERAAQIQKAPPVAGPSAFKVPTSDRAGTGGIQMFLSDIDVELFAAARVVFVTL